MDKYEKIYYVEQKKPDAKLYIVYNSIYIKSRRDCGWKSEIRGERH